MRSNIRITSVLFLLIAAVAHAADIWVDAGANDAGDGSDKKPFKRIQKAAEIASAGDTVHVLPGVYRERVMPQRGGEPDKPIVYISEVLHGAEVKGSDLWTPEWVDEGGGLFSGKVDETLFTDKAYIDGGNPYRISYYYERERSVRPPFPYKSVSWTLGQVAMDDRLLNERSTRQELMTTKNGWWYDADRNRIVVNSGSVDPKGHRFEITTRRGVFRPLKKGLGYIEVRGFVFKHCANQFNGQFWVKPENSQSGMVGTRSGHHWTIVSNVISSAKSVGLTFGNSGGGSSRKAFDNETPAQVEPPSGTIGYHLIEGNRFESNGAIGAMGFNSRGVMIKNNVFTKNNRLLNMSYETGAIKTHVAHDLRVEGNWFIDNECMGVWIDNTWKNCRVTRNVFIGNRGRNVFFEMDNNTPATASVVAYNIFLEGRPALALFGKGSPEEQPWKPWSIGVYGHDADGININHNLFAGVSYAMYFRKVSNRKGGAAYINASANLFCSKALPSLCIPVDDPPNVRGNIFDFNIYPVMQQTFAATGWSLDTGGVNKDSIAKIIAGVEKHEAVPFCAQNKSPSGYLLNLDQWRKITGFDRNSVVAQVSCSFNRNSSVLTLDVNEAVLGVRVSAPTDSKGDYFGKKISGSLPAGPFADLKVGKQSLNLKMPEL